MVHSPSGSRISGAVVLHHHDTAILQQFGAEETGGTNVVVVLFLVVSRQAHKPFLVTRVADGVAVEQVTLLGGARRTGTDGASQAGVNDPVDPVPTLDLHRRPTEGLDFHVVVGGI